MAEIQVDRKKFLATVGAGALAAMTPEDKAEELEHYMIDLLEGHDHDHGPQEDRSCSARALPPYPQASSPLELLLPLSRETFSDRLGSQPS